MTKAIRIFVGTTNETVKSLFTISLKQKLMIMIPRTGHTVLDFARPELDGNRLLL